MERLPGCPGSRPKELFRVLRLAGGRRAAEGPEIRIQPVIADGRLLVGEPRQEGLILWVVAVNGELDADERITNLEQVRAAVLRCERR